MAVQELCEDRRAHADPSPSEIQERCREVLSWRENRHGLRRRRKRERQARLVAMIRHHGPTRSEAIGKALGATRSEVRTDLAQLIGAGIVVRASGWGNRPRYRLADDSEPVFECGAQDFTGDLPSADRIIAEIRSRAARKGVRS